MHLSQNKNMMQRLIKSVLSNKINIFSSQLTSLSCWPGCLSRHWCWCWCAGWGCPAWCCCTPCTPCSRTPSHPPAQDQPIERSCTCWYRQISCWSSDTRPAPSSHWPPCWLRRSQPSGHLHMGKPKQVTHLEPSRLQKWFWCFQYFNIYPVKDSRCSNHDISWKCSNYDQLSYFWCRFLKKWICRILSQNNESDMHLLSKMIVGL